MALLHSHSVLDKAKNEIQKSELLQYAIRSNGNSRKVSVNKKMRKGEPRT